MIEKNSKYESPFMKILQLSDDDIVTASGNGGNNYYEWDWSGDEIYNDGWFN